MFTTLCDCCLQEVDNNMLDYQNENGDYICIDCSSKEQETGEPMTEKDWQELEEYFAKNNLKLK